METLVVDGYNVIHAWADLRSLIATSLQEAREALVGRLAVYHQVRDTDVTVVFDAHLTQARSTTVEERDGVRILYTKRGISADHVIERLAYKAGRAGRPILVATSDSFHRDMLRGMGAGVINAAELERLVMAAELDLSQQLRRRYS